MIADAAFTCDKNSAITSTTKNPALRNPTSTAVDATFACDTGNTTKNPALPASAITEVTNNPPTLGIGATTIDKPSSLLAKVTNLVSVPNIGSSNVTIDDPTRITGPTIHNATPTVEPSDALAHNSPAASSAQNANTALERDDPPIPIHNKDTPFEFDDETPLDANAPTKRGNAPAPSASSEPLETPNDDASQDNHLLVEPAPSVSEDQLAKTDQDRIEWLRGELCEMVGKRRKYKAEVEVLEKRMATAGNGGMYCEAKHFYWTNNSTETIVVDESGSSICKYCDLTPSYRHLRLE
jgi:hypothetical protein